MTEQTRAVARYDGPRTVDELIRYAAVLASNPEGNNRRNEALPVAFRDNPAALAFVVEYAKALDVSPVTAIMGVHMIDGKLAASAGLISALVRRAGHRIRTWIEGTVEGGDLKAVTTITRHDDPDHEYRSEWTLSRAMRAELCTTALDPATGRWTVTNKTKSGMAGNWEKYPENMAKARSVTECARDAAEDAILGVHYTPEELGVDVDEEGAPVYTVTQVPPTPAYTPPPTQPAPETPAGGETPTPPPAAPDPGQDAHDEVVDAAVLADELRSQILAAQTRDDLGKVWTGPLLGGTGQTEKARALVCGDENGVETTVLDLFTRQAAAIGAGNPLVDDPGPDDGTPAQTPQDPDTGPPLPPSYVGQGQDVTLDEAIAKGETVPGVVLDPVAGRGDTKGRTEAAAAPNRSALTLVLNALSPTQLDAVADWCRLNGVRPENGEDDCAAILEEVTLGNVFRNDDAPPDPEELVRNALGGVVIDRQGHGVEETHRRTLAERDAALAEDRQETARAAREHGRPRGTGRAAFDQARGKATP